MHNDESFDQLNSTLDAITVCSQGHAKVLGKWEGILVLKVTRLKKLLINFKIACGCSLDILLWIFSRHPAMDVL